MYTSSGASYSYASSTFQGFRRRTQTSSAKSFRGRHLSQGKSSIIHTTDYHSPIDPEDTDEMSDFFLKMILDKDLSPEGSQSQSSIDYDPSLREDFLDLLKDIVIDVPEAETKLTGRESHACGRKRFPRYPPLPLVARCTPKQVSKMGKRQVPMHVATLPHVVENRNQVLKRLNPSRPSENYEAWLRRKQVLQDEALNCLTLEDLLHIHQTCPQGSVEVPLGFNAIALRNIKTCISLSFWNALMGYDSDRLSSADNETSKETTRSQP